MWLDFRFFMLWYANVFTRKVIQTQAYIIKYYICCIEAEKICFLYFSEPNLLFLGKLLY